MRQLLAKQVRCAANGGLADSLQADANRANRSGWTALMYAAYLGRDTVVNLLLEHADTQVDVPGPGGVTALMRACANAHESVVYFLIQARAMRRSSCVMRAARRVGGCAGRRGPVGHLSRGQQEQCGVWMACPATHHAARR